MKKYGMLGPAAPELGWVPAPRYLLRRSLVLREIREMEPCETLEIGPGAGVLLHELDDLHFRCTALESSADARKLAETLAHDAHKPIRFVGQPGSDWSGRFQLLMAFEVLEHIEHDLDALKTWHSWMAKEGTLLLSVPSHMAKWNPSDVWAGHFRRYERNPLTKLLEQSGFVVEKIECYGFPLANVGEKVRAAKAAPEIDESVDKTQAGRRSNTDRSGIDRRHSIKWFPIYSSPLGKLALKTADLVQRQFLQTELGNGYLVRAIKMKS